MATSPPPSRVSPPLQSRGTKSEVAHWWAKWLRHPCRLGDPHRFRAGGQNQKWPTCGQGGYVTPAILGIPTASGRGDKIRSGPLVGKMATSPLPSRGSPPLQSGGTKSEVAHLWARWLRQPCRLGYPHRFRAGGQNQKWPTCGQNGYVTPAVSGIPTASERGDKIRSGPLVGKMPTSPHAVSGIPSASQRGDKIRSGPLVGKVATSPLPSRGSPPLQSGGTKSEVAHLWTRWLRHPCRLGDARRFRAGGQNQKWPTCGQNGYVIPAVSGIPTASERGDKIRTGPLVGKMATSPLPSRGSPPLQSGGTKSEVAHLWTRWLRHPCRLGDPHRFRAGGQNQKWPTCGQGGYVTPAVSGIPTASERGDKIRSGPLVGKVATSPLPSRGSPPLQSGGTKSEVAHLWAKWLRHPCRLGDHHRFRAGRQNQKWPTCGQNGYVTPAVSGITTAPERGDKIRSGPLVDKVATSRLPSRGSPPLQSGGTKSEVAHLWPKWLRHPCRLGDPHRFRAGGQNQKWPTCGQGGYVTPAVSGIPTASERGDKIRSGPLVGKVATSPLPSRGCPPLQSGGTKSEVAHLWARWLRHPSERGDKIRSAVSGIPTASERGDKIRSGPLVGKVATSPLPSRGSSPLQSGATKSEVAHLRARWLRHPCRLGDPHRFRAGGTKSGVAHLWTRWLRHPCRLGDTHRFRAGRQNQKWPSCGQGGYVTPAVSGIPTVSERGDKIRSGPLVGHVATSPLPSRGSPPLQSGGTKSEVAHLWAKWLRHPRRLGYPHRFRAGGQNQKWPTGGQNGYVTPAVSGIPTASERGDKIRSGPLVGKVATSPLPSWGSPPLQGGGTKSEVAHLWAKWLRHPCRLGDPHRFRAGGQNQKWPTCGQGGYVNPAVSGIPTASERGDKIRSGPLVAKMATSRLPFRGSPPLQSGAAKSEVAHLWAKCLRHPMPSRGSPALHSGGTKSEVAHLWARWLRHPCRLGDHHRFRAGGQNQKWPTCGQGGYVTPAVSGMRAASERGDKIRSGPLAGKMATSSLPSRGSPPLQSGGTKSELAHLWAKWLRHPCRLGDHHRFRAGGQNQKWPTCGQGGYVTPAVSGIPTASERGDKIRSGPLVGKVATSPLPSRGSPPLQSGGTKSEVAHLWARWLCHPCRLGDPHRFRAGRQNQKWPTCGQGGYVNPAVSGIPTASERGDKIRSGPLVGKMATSPLPSRGSPPLQSWGTKSEVAHLWTRWLRHPCRLGDPHRFRAGGQNQKWPTCGQGGYVTPAVSGIPTASERGDKIRSGPLVGKVATSPLPSRVSPPLQSGATKSEVAHLRARWLRHPCRLGDPHRFRAGGQNQKWPTCGQGGYVTPAVSGIPTASERGDKIRSGPLVGKVATSPLPSRGSPPLESGATKSEVAHLRARWLRHPSPRGSPPLQSGGTKSEVAHSERGDKMWARWLRHPCRLGDPHRFRAGGQNQKWPTCGQGGYVTPAVSGIPTASERGDKIRSGPLVGKVATSPLPSRGSPPLQSGGDKIRSGPLVGKVATSPLPSRGSPPLQSGGTKSEVAHLWARWLRHPCRLGDPHRFRAGGQNQKWPTCGQGGYVTPAVSGIPTASERGDKIRSGPLVGNGYVTPAVSGIPTASERGDKIRSGPLVGKVATSPLPSRGSPPLQSGGTKSEVAHLWARWLRHPCRLGDPHRFRAGGQNQKWPTCGQGGYVTPAVSGIPTASERGDKIRSGPLVGKVATSPLPSRGSPPLQSGGTKSEVAHLWARWLRHPCRLGDPHRFRAGGQNQKWPTCGQGGYVTPAVSGIPTASERGDKIRSGPLVGKVATSPLPSRGSPPLQSGGTKSEVAHLWARWLRHPCRLGDPHRFRAGGVAQRWLRHPCRLGDPHRFRAGGQNQKWPTCGQGGYVTPDPHRFRAGGQNQKWPTCGQGGYVTPAVSGIPTASERGDKIRSGPLVGKVATSPLPSRGSPPLQSGGTKSEVAHLWARWLRHPCRLGDPHRFRAGGQNQKWPTCGQGGYVTPAVSGIPTASERGDKIRSGPLVGKVATSPLPSRGSPPLQSGGTKSEVAHLWARWLRHPAVSGIPTASERGDKIRSGPLVGKVATSSRGSPPLQSGATKSEVAHLWARWLRHPCRLGDPHRFRAGGQNQKWPTCGQGGYVTPAVSGIPTASERGDKIRSGPLVGKVATSPLPSRGSPPLQSGGTKSEVAHLWARWLRHPCRLGDPHRFRAGGQNQKWPTCGQGLAIRSGPLCACRLGDPHRFRAGGQNQKWPTCGQGGYVTPAVSGIPTASERGDKIRSGPLVGKVATSPLPSRGSPPLQSGGTKSEVAHLWARWLRHPCRLGDPHRFRAGRQNQKWPTCGQGGYVTPAVSGIPTASERGDKIRSGPLVGKVATSPLPSRGSPPLQSGGTKSEVAHLWARWLRHPCRLGDPHRFRAGGQNQKWPTCGQGGYVTPAVSGIPTASERGDKIRSGPLVGKVATSPLPSRGSPPLQSGGTKSEVAHLWARWLRHPCRLGDPHRFRAGGQNQKWPTCGQGGYVTPAVSGMPTASERGDKIRSGPLVDMVATSPLPSQGSPPLQTGDKIRSGPGGLSGQSGGTKVGLRHPCRLGDPHRFPTAQSGGIPTASEQGQNQKWPTCGQNGYVTPAVSGIPTASERGDKIRSGPLVGKVATYTPAVSGIPTASERGDKIRSGPLVWLRHPCRLGDPHRFRAGGQNQKWPTCGQGGYVTPAVLGIPTASERGDKIRSGPLVGKMPTSPLPSRSPPLQSGATNSEVAHLWAKCPPLQSGGTNSEVAHLWARWLRRGSPPLQSGGTKSEVAHLWAKWLRHACRLGDPHRFRAGRQNQKWPTCGQGGYVTPAVLGIPTASERGDKIRSGPLVGKVATSPLPSRVSPPLQSGGTKSEVAHLWAKWLRHPCRLGDPHRFRRGDKIKWPTCGQGGYVTPAVSGIPTASERGDKIRSGPLVDKVATSPLPSR